MSVIAAVGLEELRLVAEEFTVKILNSRHRDVVEPLRDLLERLIQEAAAGAFAGAEAEIEAARARAANAEYNAATWEVAAYATREALSAYPVLTGSHHPW